MSHALDLPEAYRRVAINYVTFISHKHRLIYVATSKAGCSTIKHTPMQAELERGDIRFAEMDDIHDRAAHPLETPAQQADFPALLADSGYFKFCFVRDPYVRILSAYLDKLVRRRDGFMRQTTLERLGAPQGYTPSFAAFVDLVQRVDPDIFDGHTERQTTRTLHGVISYDFIGRFERFEDDLRFALTRCGIDFDRYFYAEKRHASSAGAKLAQAYDRATAARVRDMYAGDFEVFGYSPEPDWLKAL